MAAVVVTDVVVWDSERSLREPRARAQVEVLRVAAGDTDALRFVPEAHRAYTGRFLARGDDGFVALVDGAFAGWAWLCHVTHRDRYSGLRIRLASDEAYGHSLEVVPEMRPHGVAAVLLTRMLSHARDEAAVTRVYGWVDRGNRTSQMLHRMLGFSTTQTVRRVHLFRRTGFALPRSATPPYGPLSRAGRHRDAG